MLSCCLSTFAVFRDASCAEHACPLLHICSTSQTKFSSSASHSAWINLRCNRSCSAFGIASSAKHASSGFLAASSAILSASIISRCTRSFSSALLPVLAISHRKRSSLSFWAASRTKCSSCALHFALIISRCKRCSTVHAASAISRSKRSSILFCTTSCSSSALRFASINSRCTHCSSAMRTASAISCCKHSSSVLCAASCAKRSSSALLALSSALRATRSSSAIHSGPIISCCKSP
mmetsp:Transcript_16153/g.43516  ORF Transcript_16153/g.43516 Transcript_16153/m.43516 type:complete len:237 (+) Transcript_16153:373-1083(+)